MYLESTLPVSECPSFGVKFTPEEVAAAKDGKIEVYCSSFSDQGADFSIFKLISDTGKEVASRRVNGY